MEAKAKAPFWKPALIYGGILAFISIFLSLVFYFLNMTTTRWTSWVSMLIGLVVIVYLMLQYRKDYLGGYASFGQIFLMAFIASLISTLLTVLYTYLLYTVIDPGLIEKIKLAAEEQILNNPRIPENMVDDILERTNERTTPAYIIRIALISGPIVNAIIALIIAAFVKKEEPVNPMA